MSIPKAVSGSTIEIIAFMLHDQQFCVRTTSIREIRGWAPVTPLPKAPSDVMGVINLRGSVIPIVDLASRLGMPQGQISERSAIVVTSVDDRTIGLMVDRVSDILTVAYETLQPIPAAADTGSGYAEGMFTREDAMICLLNLEAIFGKETIAEYAEVF